MGTSLENSYLSIMYNLLHYGAEREGRNGKIRSMPFKELAWVARTHIPIITTRAMVWKPALGEYAAILRGPKHVDDFKKFGCNYWGKWAKEDGSLNLDYGNWKGQAEYILDKLNGGKYGDRRLLINTWYPERISSLDLPCCHYSYQFWSDGTELSLLWNQRSADWCIGVPHDMVLAHTMLHHFANLTGLTPGIIKMIFGDAHIYEQHFEGAAKQVKRTPWFPPIFEMKEQTNLYDFIPEDVTITDYQSHEAIKYEVIA